jgi:hypothetical protein
LPLPALVADLEIFRLVLSLGNLLPPELVARFNANIGRVLDKLKSARLLGGAVAQVVDRQDCVIGQFLRARAEVAAIVTAGGQANGHSGHECK